MFRTKQLKTKIKEEKKLKIGDHVGCINIVICTENPEMPEQVDACLYLVAVFTLTVSVLGNNKKSRYGRHKDLLVIYLHLV